QPEGADDHPAPSYASLCHEGSVLVNPADEDAGMHVARPMEGMDAEDDLLWCEIGKSEIYSVVRGDVTEHHIAADPTEAAGPFPA
ncbi:MAG: hypothetical protein CUN48_18320, partial [Candidatus Thermofonsia Clade 3 bacterium]